MAGDFFQLHRQFQLRVVDAQLLEDLVAGLLHDLGARVEVLVDTMAEAHQLERIVLVLGLLDELVDVGHVADLVEHAQHRFVRAAMGRSPQGGDAGGDAGERIGAGGAGQTHRGGGGVLLVVGVENEDAVHGLGQHGADRLGLAGGLNIMWRKFSA